MSQLAGLSLILLGGALFIGTPYLPSNIQTTLNQGLYCFGLSTILGCGGYNLTLGTTITGGAILLGVLLMLRPEPTVVVVKETK